MPKQFPYDLHRLKQHHLDSHPNHQHRCREEHLNDSKDLIQSVLPIHLAFRRQRKDKVGEWKSHPNCIYLNPREEGQYQAKGLHPQLMLRWWYRQEVNSGMMR